MDENNARPEDFICDFCLNHWATSRPMVEGHKGSLICGPCLTVAYTEVAITKTGVLVPDPVACTLCLQHKGDEPYWVSPLAEGARACKWCIDKSARMLEKDKDADWVRPASAPV